MKQSELSEAISQPIKCNAYIKVGEDIYLHIDSFHYGAGPIDPNSEDWTWRMDDALISQAIVENTDGFVFWQLDGRHLVVTGGLRRSECVSVTYEREELSGKMTVLLPPDHPLAIRQKERDAELAHWEAQRAEKNAARRAKAAARRAEKAQLAAAA